MRTIVSIVLFLVATMPPASADHLMPHVNVLAPAMLAQAGSTGGTIGKQGKSASGGSENAVQGASPPQSSRNVPNGGSRGTSGGIAVMSATYGGNCGVALGNMTQTLRRACNGKSICNYVIDYQVIGDPKPFCAKDYTAEWRCHDGSKYSSSVAPEAGYRKTISLSCE